MPAGNWRASRRTETESSGRSGQAAGRGHGQHRGVGQGGGVQAGLPLQYLAAPVDHSCSRPSGVSSRAVQCSTQSPSLQ